MAVQVCVGPGLKPQRLVFSQRGSNKFPCYHNWLNLANVSILIPNGTFMSFTILKMHTMCRTKYPPKACITSALQQPCTYLRRQICWFRTAAPRCCEQHRKTAVQKQGRKAASTNFRHVHFLRDLFVFSGRRTTAARHTRLLQDTQGVPTTDVKVCQPLICLTTAARLPQCKCALYRKATARMLRNARCSAGHL